MGVALLWKLCGIFGKHVALPYMKNEPCQPSPQPNFICLYPSDAKHISGWAF